MTKDNMVLTVDGVEVEWGTPENFPQAGVMETIDHKTLLSSMTDEERTAFIYEGEMPNWSDHGH